MKLSSQYLTKVARGVYATTTLNGGCPSIPIDYIHAVYHNIWEKIQMFEQLYVEVIATHNRTNNNENQNR